MSVAWWQIIVLLLTACVIVLYTYETCKLTKQNINDAKYDMIYRTYNQLANTKSKINRRCLYNEFPEK